MLIFFFLIVPLHRLLNTFPKAVPSRLAVKKRCLSGFVVYMADSAGHSSDNNEINRSLDSRLRFGRALFFCFAAVQQHSSTAHSNSSAETPAQQYMHSSCASGGSIHIHTAVGSV